MVHTILREIAFPAGLESSLGEMATCVAGRGREPPPPQGLHAVVRVCRFGGDEDWGSAGRRRWARTLLLRGGVEPNPGPAPPSRNASTPTTVDPALVAAVVAALSAAGLSVGGGAGTRRPRDDSAPRSVARASRRRSSRAESRSDSTQECHDFKRGACNRAVCKYRHISAHVREGVSFADAAANARSPASPARLASPARPSASSARPSAPPARPSAPPARPSASPAPPSRPPAPLPNAAEDVPPAPLENLISACANLPLRAALSLERRVIALQAEFTQALVGEYSKYLSDQPWLPS